MSPGRADARLLVLQHARVEPPGVYEHELRERGVPFDRFVLDEGEPAPDWRPYAGLVVMGGGMGVYEADRHPWLKAELALIGEAVREDLPYWGVCLGAQLLAAALGARVAGGPPPGRGGGGGARGPPPPPGALALALPLRQPRDPVFASAPERFRSLQWHGDTYELPAGAVQLARSRAYEQQAFVHGRAYGVQFHLEVDRPLAERWAQVPAYVEDLERHGGPGAAARMVAQVAAIERESVPLARALFGRWLSSVAGLGA